MAQRGMKTLLSGDEGVGRTSLRMREQRSPDLDVKDDLWDMYGEKINKGLSSSNYFASARRKINIGE